MPVATTKNLTILGILGLVASAITMIAIPLLDGDPSTTPNFGAFGAALMAALTAILAKGAANTGGTVPTTPEAEQRVAAMKGRAAAAGTAPLPTRPRT